MISQPADYIAQYPNQWQHDTDSLQANQIHLHLVKLDVKKNTLERWLTAQHIKRAARFTNQQSRTRYLNGRATLHQLLCQYSGLTTTELSFDYGDRGKPILKNCIADKQLHFNYTLSKNYALYAFSWNRELGIDIELFPRTINLPSIAKRILSASEYTLWSALPEKQKHQALLACWTRKEAYGKLLGIGIRYFMNRATLLHSIDNPCWTTQVAGLFDGHPMQNNLLCGVQLALPISGVACLMFDSKISYDDSNSAVPVFDNIDLCSYHHTID